MTLSVIAPLSNMKLNKLPPIHPGEILPEEFMKPRGLSQNASGRALNVPPRRINEIVLEKRAITADTALRLARYFGASADCGRACRRITTCGWLVTRSSGKSNER
jgi:addiction module HigA family antidote